MIWNNVYGKILMTLLISMVPVIELRGAIPIATAAGLDLRAVIITAVIGNLIPVPFIIFFIKKIFAWMKKKNKKLRDFVAKQEARAEKKADAVRRSTFWGLALFVAIPLPGTGAWTGALIAAMLDMPMKRAFLSITIGVIVAAVIVASLTYGVGALIFGTDAIALT